MLRAEEPGRRLFPSGDEDALLAALQRSLADPQAERAGAERLRDEVLDRYRWDAAVDALEQLYVRVTDT